MELVIARFVVAFLFSMAMMWGSLLLAEKT